MVVETQGPADSVGELEQVAWRADWLREDHLGFWIYGPKAPQTRPSSVIFGPDYGELRYTVYGPDGQREDFKDRREGYAHSWITALMLAHDMILHPRPRTTTTVGES